MLLPQDGTFQYELLAARTDNGANIVIRSLTPGSNNPTHCLLAAG
jgi:hypothetical protein